MSNEDLVAMLLIVGIPMVLFLLFWTLTLLGYVEKMWGRKDNEEDRNKVKEKKIEN